MAKVYNVCYPREYKDGDGNERTDFIRVGVAFPLREQDGFSLELAVPLLLKAGSRLVILAREPNESESQTTQSSRNGSRRTRR